MSASLSRSYPVAAAAGEVFDALTSQAWVDHRAARLHDGSRTERRETDAAGRCTVAVSRVLPDGVPGYLTPFLPADRRVVQTDVWEPAAGDGVRRGTWQADLPGAPAGISGTQALLPQGAGCLHRIEGEVRVRVPVVGGRAERFLVDMLERLLDREAEELAALLGSATG